MITNLPVTQQSYAGCVTPPERLKCRSGAYRGSRDAGYATSPETPTHAGVRARARASACAYTCVLRNYVTKKKEKKEEQVRASKSGYARGYAPVTCRVTAPLPLRAEVTHA